MYIYLDESGDLGFDFSKRGTSRYFVITLLVCHHQAAQKSIVQAIRRTVKNKINVRKKRIGKPCELKGTNTTLAQKDYFYRHIKSSDWALYAMVLNKRRLVREGISHSKIYNFLSRHIIEKLPLSDVTVNVRLVVDKSKNVADVFEFNHYIRSYVEGALPLRTGFTVEHLDSCEDACLQAVDLFCWGIARKYKNNDTEWYDEFKGKIEFEDMYSP